MELTDFDKNLLNILQEQLPISERPFKEIGQKLNVSEEVVINRIKELKDADYIRRIGAFFDSNKLGYVGTLVALKVKADNVQTIAEFVNNFSGVTHNYEREGKFNLWFTLLSENIDKEKSILDTIRAKDGVEELLSLKAKHKYKINVAFKLR